VGFGVSRSVGPGLGASPNRSYGGGKERHSMNAVGSFGGWPQSDRPVCGVVFSLGHRRTSFLIKGLLPASSKGGEERNLVYHWQAFAGAAGGGVPTK